MQAILITAYKDSNQLIKLTELLHDKYAVYILIKKELASLMSKNCLT